MGESRQRDVRKKSYLYQVLKNEEDSETSLNKIYISLEEEMLLYYWENKNKQQNKQLCLIKQYQHPSSIYSQLNYDLPLANLPTLPHISQCPISNPSPNFIHFSLLNISQIYPILSSPSPSLQSELPSSPAPIITTAF